MKLKSTEPDSQFRQFSWLNLLLHWSRLFISLSRIMRSIMRSVKENMASKALKRKSTVPALLECAYCLEVYDDPRNLPCGHTFCFKCLRKTVENEQNESSLLCGLCRKSWQVPVDGLAELPKNYVADSFRASIPPASACILAEDHSTDHGPVEYFCIECWEALCSTCRKGHKMTRLTRNHKIKPVRDLSKEDIEEHSHKVSSTCSTHRGQEVVVYCTECKEVACTICCVTKHAKHDCVELEKADKDFVKTITEKLNEGRKVKEEIKSEESRIEKTHAALAEQQKTTSEQVKSDAEEGRQKIKEFCEAMLQRIDFLEKKILLKINDNLNNKFKDEIEEFKNHIKTVNLQNLDCERLLPPASCAVERASLAGELSSRNLNTRKSRLLPEDWNNYLTSVAALMKYTVNFTPNYVPPQANLINSYCERGMNNQYNYYLSVCDGNLLFSQGENNSQLCIRDKNFSVLSNPTAPVPVRDAILLSNGNIVFSTNDSILVMSQDNKILGTNKMTSPNGISISKKNTIYMCADKLILCSADCGLTWKKVFEIAEDKQLMFAVCIKDNIFWVIELCKTTNAYQLSEYTVDDKQKVTQHDIDNSSRISARGRMAYDNDDIVYITNFDDSAVLMYRTSSRQYIGQLLNNSHVSNPAGIAVDMDKDLLYVCHHTRYYGQPDAYVCIYNVICPNISCYRLPPTAEGKYLYTLQMTI